MLSNSQSWHRRILRNFVKVRSKEARQILGADPAGNSVEVHRFEGRYGIALNVMDVIALRLGSNVR